MVCPLGQLLNEGTGLEGHQVLFQLWQFLVLKNLCAHCTKKGRLQDAEWAGSEGYDLQGQEDPIHILVLPRTCSMNAGKVLACVSLAFLAFPSVIIWSAFVWNKTMYLMSLHSACCATKL